MFNQIQSILLIAALALSPFVYGDTATDSREKLYAVELIVFERYEQANQQDPELWPKNVSLAYPYPWQRLLEPSEGDSPEIIANSEQVRLPYGNPPPTLADGDADQMPSGQASPGGETTQDGLAQPADENPGDPQQAYVYLPSEQAELKAEARALNRAPELRILYHKRWRQSLKPQEDAAALVLRGGNLFGDHYELEGSITLFLSRYIHLRTNLWLAQFVPNHGQVQEHWPDLPAPPWELASATKLLHADAYGAQDPLLDTDPDLGHDAGGSLYTGALADQNSANRYDASWLADEHEQSPYLVSQVVTLNQARRMRSNELHYLDHPRLGLLIRVTPVKPEATAKDISGA